MPKVLLQLTLVEDVNILSSPGPLWSAGGARRFKGFGVLETCFVDMAELKKEPSSTESIGLHSNSASKRTPPPCHPAQIHQPWPLVAHFSPTSQMLADGAGIPIGVCKRYVADSAARLKVTFQVELVTSDIL